MKSLLLINVERLTQTSMVVDLTWLHHICCNGITNFLYMVLWLVCLRPGHGSPDPNNPTQPARKKPDPTRPELRGGWARAVFFDPQQSTGRARAVIFDPKPDPTRKTRPKGQKTRPNPKKTRPDTPAQGARANPTRPGDRYGSGAGRPMRPVTRP